MQENGFKKNRSWLNKIPLFRVTNEKNDFSLERITSDTFLFSAATVSVLSCIFNFVENFHLILKLFTVFSSILLLVLYYFSRFRNYHNIWISAFTVLTLLSVSWFMNGGAVGSVSFMYLCTVMILNFIAKPTQQNRLFYLIFSNIIILYSLEYFFSNQLIHSYPDQTTYYFDMIFVFLVVLFCVFFSTRFIKRAYEIERKLVKDRTRELEISNEKRTNVFINLAHETKTPLMLIINYLEDYIHKNGKSEDEDLKLLKKSINSLTKDILHFFDMEKIQKGISMYDHHQIADFSKLLNDSIKLFKVYAAKKDIEISSTISEEIFLKADPGSLLRVINNLIENAIKYTAKGGRVEACLENTDAGIVFSVKDNGIGIPVLQHNKIFEPYFQINSAKANFQGIGLGLSIVKNVVDELEGSIRIISDPEKNAGTQIIINFPFYKKKENELVVDPENTIVHFEVETLNIKDQDFEDDKFTILIVEDDIALLNYIGGSLQKNYNIYVAVNGQEAIEKLKTIPQLDLIISDVMMDNGDGFCLYQYVLSSKKLNHVPFIFLTANGSSSSRMKGLSMGAIDYIGKPVSLDELSIKMNSILKNLASQRIAIVNHAYNTIVKNKYENESVESGSNSFRDNCSKYNLTNREIDVIKLMIEGKINKEIAAALSISTDTVKKHVQNSYEKAEVNNKFELLKKLIP